MKKIHFLIVSIGISTMAWGQSGTEQKIAAAVATFNNALVAQDSVALKGVTAHALSYGHSSGKIENQQAFVTNAVTGALKFVSITATDQTIAVQKHTAIVRHVFNGKAITNGNASDLKLGVLQIWQKERGGWKLLARQACKLP